LGATRVSTATAVTGYSRLLDRATPTGANSAATTHYVIRYRLGGSRPAVLIEDDGENAFIVTTGGLLCPLTGSRDLSSLEPVLRHHGWMPVPKVAPYCLDEIRRLLIPDT
jgi:hypothetical protein